MLMKCYVFKPEVLVKDVFLSNGWHKREVFGKYLVVKSAWFKSQMKFYMILNVGKVYNV